MISKEKQKVRNREYQRAWRAKQGKEQVNKRARETARKYRQTANGAYTQLKHKKQGLVLITRENFVAWWDATPKVCHYCGRPVESGTTLDCRSIDRKDAKLGYCLGNIAIACCRCNLMKGYWLTEEQMLDATRRYFGA